MATYRIQAPDGRIYRIEGPDGASNEQVVAAVLEQHPEAGTPASPEGGFTPAVKSGYERLKGELGLLAGKTGIISPEEATRYKEAREAEAQRIFKPTEEGWTEAPWQKLKETAGGSLPYMVAPLVAGGAATVLGAPGAVAAGLGALASGTQFTASNLARAVEEGKTLEEASLGKAAAAAVPQAALDMLSFRMMPGIGKIFGAAGKEITEETARAIAVQTLKQKAAEYAMATGKTMTAEGFTETAQQILERLQAGLSITDPKARDEYLESFIGGAALAGAMGPGGHYMDRRGQVAKSEALTQARLAKEAQQAAETSRIEQEKEAARRQTPEYLADIEQRYNEALAGIKQLQRVEKPKLPKGATPEQEIAHEEALAAYEAQKQQNTEAMAAFKPIRDEYKAALPLIQKQRAQAAAAEESRMQAIETEAARTQPTAADVARTPGEQVPMFGDSTADETRVAETLAAEKERSMYGPESQRALYEDLFGEKKTAPEETPEAQRSRLSTELRGLEDYRNQLRERLQTVQTLAEAQKLAAEEKTVVQAMEQAQAKLNAIQIEAAPTATQLNKAVQKLEQQAQKAREEGDINAFAKIMAKLEEKRKEAAAAPAEQTTIPAKQFDMFGGKSETTDEFNQRVVGPEIADERERRAAVEQRVASEAEALQRIGSREELTPLIQQVKQERATGREIQEVERQAAMDRAATAQGELFKTSETPAPTTRTITPSRVTPQALTNLLTRAETAPRMAEADRALLQSVKNNLPAITASPDKARIDDIADWAYQAALGNQMPDRRAGIESMLRALEEGKRSETEQLTQAQQRALTKEEKRAIQGITPGTIKGPQTSATSKRGVMERGETGETRTAVQGEIPGMEPTATKFNTWREFEDYLASSALANVRDALGIEGDTAARTQRNIATLENVVGNLRKQLDDLAAKRDAVRAQTTAEADTASGLLRDSQSKLFELEKKLDAEMQGLQIKYLEGALNLARAQREMADVAQQISANNTLLEDQIRAYEAQVGGRDAKLTALDKARAEFKKRIDAYADAKSRMAGALEAIASGLPFDTHNRIYFDAKLEVINGKHEVVAAHQRMMQANAAIPAMPKLSSTVFRDYLQADSQLQAELNVAQGRLGGYKTAANKARTALNSAFAAQQADPAVSKALAEARSDVAVAEELRAAAARNVDVQVVPLEEQLRELGTIAEPMVRRLEELKRSIPRKAAERVKAAAPIEETAPAKEAADRESRMQEQRKLEAMYAPEGISGERVTFKNTETLRQLDNLLKQIGPLEPDAQATALKQWVAKKDRERMELDKRTDELINEQIARMEALEQHKADHPNQTQKTAQKEAVIKNQFEVLRKRAGAMRTALESKAERAEASNRLLAETRGVKLTEEQEAELATMRKTRATSPVTRKQTSEPSALRTGSEESRAGETATNVDRKAKESFAVVERNTEISKREMQAANKAAEELRKLSETERAKQAKEAEAEAKALAEAEAEWVSDEDAELGADEVVGYDSLFSAVRDSDVYDGRASTELNSATKDAVVDGRILEVVERLQSEASTPFNRELAKRLKPLLTKVKLRVETNLKNAKGVPVEGLYNPEKMVVVMDRNAMNEEALLHELTHAATMYNLTVDPSELTADQRAARAELEALFKRVKDDPKLGKEYAKVDLKEFVSEVMSNAQVRNKLDSTRGFLGRMYDSILRLLGMSPKSVSEQAVENIYNLFSPAKPTQAATVASIVRGVFPGNQPKYASDMPEELRGIINRTVAKEATWGDKIKANAFGLGFRTQFIDRWAPTEALLQMGVKKGMLEDAKAFQTMYFMRFGEHRSQYMQQAIGDGVVQLVKNAEGDFVIEGKPGANLANIAKTLREANVGNEQAAEAAFTQYMAIMRAEHDGIGLDKLNYANPMTPAEIKAFKDYIAADPKRKLAFEAARKEYQEYNDNLLDFVVQSGAMSKTEAARLKGKDYVPYYREEADGAVNLIVGNEKPVRIGNIYDQPYLRELLGDNKKILPFFASSVQNTSMLLDMALRNLQVKSVAHTLRGMKMAVVRDGIAPQGNNIVTFKEHGALKYVIIDTDAYGIPADLLVKGMQGIKTTIPAIVRAMSIPANILRTAVTRMPTYAIRQAIRDPLNAWLTTGGDFKPILSSFKELTKMVAGRSPNELMLQRAGAISSNVITGGREDATRVLRALAGGDKGWSKHMAKLDAFAMQGDAATRAVLYDRYRKQGMTHMQALLGSVESMNFSRRGVSPSMQFLSMMIPFFNAQVQGLDVIYRAAAGKAVFEKQADVQRKLITRGAMLAITTLAYAALMQDDEAYQNATPEERAQNWFVYVPGIDEPVHIPIPFELGMAFKALPEMIFNVAAGDQKASNAAKAFGALMYNSVPFGLPQAIKPVVELAANHSFFGGRAIESTREKQLTPSERFRENTTELAKTLGGVANVSPIQIEHLVRGYTGSIGIVLMDLLSVPLKPFAAEAPEAPTKLLSQYPIIGALFQPKDGRGIINEVYGMVEETQQASQTFKRMLEQGRRADAEAFINHHAAKVAMDSLGGQFKQQMGEFAQIRRAIAASDMTPAEKRQSIDDIKQLEIEYARAIREAMNAASE